MSDIVERLREQGKDAFARQYSLGMFKLCTEAADEIERLRKGLTDILDASNDPYDVARATLTRPDGGGAA
jgi:hypothetical protein